MERSQVLAKLCDAVQKKQLRTFRELLDLYESDVPLDGEEGRILLSKTVRYSNYEAVQLLLERGARLNVTDASGETPLHLAVKFKNVQIIQLLLEEEAAINATNSLGRTPLHVAVISKHVKSVRLLLQKEVDINAVDCFVKTPLHYAVNRKHLKIVSLLLQKGVAVNTINRSGSTALHEAATHGFVEIVEVLLNKGADVNITNNSGRTPLFNAADRGHLKIAELLLDKGASVNVADHSKLTPLHLAVDHRQAKVVKLLLEKEASVTAADCSGRTPLHIAVNFGRVKVLKLLLEKEGAFNAVDNSDRSPLHIAIDNECFDFVKLLLEKGADVNYADRLERSPLHFAVDVENVDIVNLLLQKGADVNVRDTLYVRTPLHHAVCREHVKIVQSLLLKDNKAVNIEDDDGRTPLLDAVALENLEIAKLLLQNKAAVNAAHVMRQTPLHSALKSEPLKLEMVDLLLSYGADVNACDSFYDTPLFYAVKHCSSEVVQKLCTNINFVITGHGSHPLKSNPIRRSARLRKQNSDGPKAPTDDGKTAVPALVAKDYSEIVDHVLKHCNLKKKRIPDLLRAAVLVDNKFFSEDLVHTLLTYGLCLSREVQNGTLFYAALRNHCDYVIVELLKNGFDVNKSYDLEDCYYWFTPFHEAVAQKSTNAAHLIISHGADVNKEDLMGDTPIQRLIFQDDKSDFPMHEFLIKTGLSDEDKTSALMSAVGRNRIDILELLAKYETDFCLKDSNGCNALHRAVFEVASPNLAIVKSLVNNGADVNAKSNTDVSVLHVAALLDPKHVEVFKTLLEFNPDVNVSCDGVTPLHLCAITRNVVFCKLLLRKGANVNAKLNTNQKTALHVAVSNKPCSDAFRTFLEGLQRTFYLMHVSLLNWEDVEEELGYSFPKVCDDVQMIGELLNYGAQVNSKDIAGKTALHYAAEFSHSGQLRELIKHGADVDARDKFSKTALQYAGLVERSSRIIRVLVSVGANINCRDSEGCTLLHKSVQTGGRHTYDLIALGSDINVLNHGNRTPLEEARSAFIKCRRLTKSISDDNKRDSSICLLLNLTLPCLMQHIVKAKAANRYVNPRNLLALGGLCYDDFYDKCKREVSTMKTAKIGKSNMLYYDIFRSSRNQLVRLANHDDLVTALEADISDKKFPTYAEELRLILQCLKQANRRKRLLDLSTEVFRSCISELPVECVDFVFDDLSDGDLENFMRAYHPDIAFPGEIHLMCDDDDLDEFPNNCIKTGDLVLRYTSDEEDHESDCDIDYGSDYD